MSGGGPAQTEWRLTAQPAPPPRDEHASPPAGRSTGAPRLWMRSREWLEDPAGAAVPNLDSLQADACGPTYSYDSNTRLKLEAKYHMRARGVKSPDEWDAVALTFAEPLAPDAGLPRRRRVNAQPHAVGALIGHFRFRPKRKASAR